jgi:dTDP-4-amino-4,6-dideoxygalactose transaminase
VGRPESGAWGHLSSVSFQSNKTITSGRRIIATDDPDLAEGNGVSRVRRFAATRPK